MQNAATAPADTPENAASGLDAAPDRSSDAGPSLESVAGSVLPAGEPANLSLIRDIEVTLSMEIGRTRLSIDRLLALVPGAVVELERQADEPLDVLVNGTLVARGEAVVVGDRFGIRLTDVVSRAERLGRL